MHWLVVPPDPLSLPPPSDHPELTGMTQIACGLDDGASPHTIQGTAVGGAGGTDLRVEGKAAAPEPHGLGNCVPVLESAASQASSVCCQLGSLCWLLRLAWGP